MAIKLILTDIDGTILPYGKKTVTRRCVDAFHAAMDAGILVGPASGRFYPWIPEFFGGDASCCATAIATNGSQVYLEGKKTLQKEVDSSCVRRAMEVLSDVDSAGLLLFEGETPCLVQGSRNDLLVCFPRYGETCVDRDGVPSAGITKANVFIRGDLERTREVVALLNREVDGLDFDVPQAQFSNVMPAGWNKGAALTWLLERLGIGRDEAVVFGDAGNDLEMFSTVDRFRRRCGGAARGACRGTLAHRRRRGRCRARRHRGACRRRLAVHALINGLSSPEPSVAFCASRGRARSCT